jgi:uncharacterized membrane protein YcaP (DUF421 family)
MHSLFSAIALHWHGFGTMIKGHPRLLVRDGWIDRRVMRDTHLTEHDLWEDLRGKGVSRLEDVAEARLERSGRISVIKTKQEDPKVIDIAVKDGTQTVRIELI